MCTCSIGEGLHWYIDINVAPYIYQIGRSPEEAEYSLRAWAGTVVRKGHIYIDLRSLAAKILASRYINMTALCDNPEHMADLINCGIIE
jgi:hypothetical protein